MKRWEAVARTSSRHMSAAVVMPTAGGKTRAIAAVRTVVPFCMRCGRAGVQEGALRAPRGGCRGRVGVFRKGYAVVVAAEGNRMRIAVTGSPRLMKSGGWWCPGR